MTSKEEAGTIFHRTHKNKTSFLLSGTNYYPDEKGAANMNRKEILENRIHTLMEDIYAAIKMGLRAADAKTRTEKAEEIQKLKKEIESYGYPVKILYNIIAKPHNPEITQSIRVRIEVWRRKKNLSSEGQKKYDAWFLRIAGICQEDHQ